MAINKPFKRIIRPKTGSDNYDSIGYIIEKYFIEMNSTARAFQLIIQNLYEITNYIEPVEANFKVYSHKIYSLFLRTATEFESNCKGILKENRYSKKGNLTIKDYYKLNAALKLYEYFIQFSQFGGGLEVQPFIEWKNSDKLCWYQDYNSVKHNREKKFKKSNLGNLFASIAGLASIIFAQYSVDGIRNFRYPISIRLNKYYDPLNNMILIKTPKWEENEKYDFDWEILKKTKRPFQNYKF